MRTLRAFFDFIFDLLYTIFVGANQAATTVGTRVVSGARQYLFFLLALTLASVAIPTIPFIAGIALGSSSLIAGAGLIWGLLALILFTIAAPIGVFINLLLRSIGVTNQRAGRAYLIFSGTVLLFGMFFSLMVVFLPLRENPSSILPILLCAAILATTGAIWGTGGILGRRVIVFITSILLVILITSLFFPRTFQGLSSIRQKIDQNLAYQLNDRLVSGTNIPICAENEKTEIVDQSNPKIEIPIYPDCWSGWVTIQVSQMNSRTPFRVYKKPEGGFLEFYFINGERLMVHQNERRWLGHIPNMTFRLRGEKGIAVVEVE
ncbi:MAG: hypothetical protein NZ484_01235 [Patescibacteria group bacterium]|nr:hypothetical protein [Patescibacteria group bacterium]MCX7589852.1 hypothetical protein [Patescibacteria group bacterium]MDW8279707.1 hypothetical protein [bacterium]